MTDQCGWLLVAALGFAGCSMPSYDRALHALRTWLDSLSWIGHVTVGMARQGYDLQLTRYDEKGWRGRSTPSSSVLPRDRHPRVDPQVAPLARGRGRAGPGRHPGAAPMKPFGITSRD